MEDINSYIVLSMNGDESIHFIPNLINGYIPNLYVAETSGQKILPNIEFLVPQNTEDGDLINNQNLVLEPTYSNNEVETENQPVEETILKCSHCGDTFNDYGMYLIHEKTHQNEEQFACTKCNKSFKKMNLYKRHLLSHQNDKLFNCAICNAGFNSENNFNVHLALHGSSTVCPICNLSFQRMASLKSHLAIHQVEEFHTCPECASEFESMVELRKHLKTHTIQTTTESKSLVCNYCKVKFDTPISLKKHVACHMKVKKLVLNGKKMKKEQGTVREYKHKCKVCGKTFPKLSLLERHLRIHNGERPFVCQICYKGFSQKGTLQIHMLKHSGIKPFCCTLCPAKFHQKGNLKVHVQKTHTASSEGEKIFKCSECDCIFKKVASLNGHMTKIHADTSTINITSVIDQLKNLEKQLDGKKIQMETEEDVDNPQNKDTVNEVDEKTSKNNINENCKVYSLMQKSVGNNKVYMCSYCDKEAKKPSDLIRHIRTHTKEKPFKCLQCSSSFALKSTLLGHMQIHKGKKCGKCSKVIYSTKVWKAHIRKHENNPDLKEQESHDDSISLSPNFSSKRRKVSSDKPLKCSFCSASFVKSVNLKRHVQLHTGEKSFKCLICSRLFAASCALKEHMNTHIGPKNHSCDICDKHFSNASLLKRHASIHDDTKPYECPYCKKRFKNLMVCRKHIDTHSESDEVENILGECNISDKEVNIPITDNLESSPTKTTILRVDKDGIVFDNTFVLQQNDTTIANSILEPVQTVDQEDIADSNGILESEQNQNLQTILVDCQDLQNREVQNYILSQLKLQSNDAIVLNAVNENNEQSPIVFNIQTLDVDTLPDVENAINEMTYTSDYVDKSVDPVLSFSEKRSLLKKNQIPILESPENCIPNDIGDNFLSNNVSLYPNTQLNFDGATELNSSTLNILDSPHHEFIEVLEKNDTNAECDILFEVPKETSQNIDLNVIHCMSCKQIFDNMASYHCHVCMKSVLKRSINISLSPKNLVQTTNQKKDYEKVELGREKEKSKNRAKRFFSCVYCGKEFTSRGVYMRHVNSHQKKEDGLHKCKFCNKEFKKPSDLARHLRTHTGEKPFACDQCDKKFSLKSTLEAHYRTHNPSATKNFVCEVCNSFFSSKASRKSHMHVHTGAKPHKCNFCDQHFRTAAHRKCHEKRIHSVGRKKVNQSNTKKITNLLSAAVEMAVNEATRDNQVIEQPEDPEYSEIQVEFPGHKYSETESIPIDQELLQQLQNSNILLQEIDPDVLACTESVDDLEAIEAAGIISGECFEENVDSISNIVGNLVCEICQEACADTATLKEHMELHLKKFECRQCTSWFSSIEALFEHEQSHLSTESYSCFLCNIVFAGIQQLKGHLRRVHQIVENSSQLIL